jgi:hypothetical protein
MRPGQVERRTHDYTPIEPSAWPRRSTPRQRQAVLRLYPQRLSDLNRHNFRIRTIARHNG